LILKESQTATFSFFNQMTPVWPKLPHEELVQVDGNFHRLAGLVQMRQQVSREEADQQVKAFLARHDVAG